MKFQLIAFLYLHFSQHPSFFPLIVLCICNRESESAFSQWKTCMHVYSAVVNDRGGFNAICPLVIVFLLSDALRAEAMGSYSRWMAKWGGEETHYLLINARCWCRRGSDGRNKTSLQQTQTADWIKCPQPKQICCVCLRRWGLQTGARELHRRWGQVR